MFFQQPHQTGLPGRVPAVDRTLTKVSMNKGTTLRVTVASRSCDEFLLIYGTSLENFLSCLIQHSMSFHHCTQRFSYFTETFAYPLYFHPTFFFIIESNRFSYITENCLPFDFHTTTFEIFSFIKWSLVMTWYTVFLAHMSSQVSVLHHCLLLFLMTQISYVIVILLMK